MSKIERVARTGLFLMTVYLLLLLVSSGCRKRTDDSALKETKYKVIAVEPEFIWELEQKYFNFLTRINKLAHLWQGYYQNSNPDQSVITIPAEQISFINGECKKLIAEIYEKIDHLQLSSSYHNSAIHTITGVFIPEPDLQSLVSSLRITVEKDTMTYNGGFLVNVLTSLSPPHNRPLLSSSIPIDKAGQVNYYLSRTKQQFHKAKILIDKWNAENLGHCLQKNCKGRDDRHLCYQTARMNGMSEFQSYQVCQDISKWTIPCIRNTQHGNLSFDTTKELCIKANRQSNQCITIASGLGVDEITIKKLCKKPTPWSGICAILADGGKVAPNSILPMCELASESTVLCLQRATAQEIKARDLEIECRSIN